MSLWLAYYRNRYAANREKVLARPCTYNAAHREKVMAQWHKYYAANREKMLSQESGYESGEEAGISP